MSECEIKIVGDSLLEQLQITGDMKKWKGVKISETIRVFLTNTTQDGLVERTPYFTTNAVTITKPTDMEYKVDIEYQPLNYPKSSKTI